MDLSSHPFVGDRWRQMRDSTQCTCASDVILNFLLAFWQVLEHFCCIEHTFPQVLSLSEWLVLVFVYIYRSFPVLTELWQITSNWLKRLFRGEWIIENWQLKILNKQKVASVVRMNHSDSSCRLRSNSHKCCVCTFWHSCWAAAFLLASWHTACDMAVTKWAPIRGAGDGGFQQRHTSGVDSRLAHTTGVCQESICGWCLLINRFLLIDAL